MIEGLVLANPPEFHIFRYVYRFAYLDRHYFAMTFVNVFMFSNSITKPMLLVFCVLCPSGTYAAL